MRNKAILSDYNRTIAMRKPGEHDPIRLDQSLLGIFGAGESTLISTFAVCGIESDDSGQYKLGADPVHSTLPDPVWSCTEYGKGKEPLQITYVPNK